MDKEMGKELDWDDQIIKDSEEYEPLPEGDYDFTVEKFERGRSKGEGKLPPCNMAIVTFRIEHEGRDVSIRENYLLHEKMEWKLSELFCGVGLKKKGEPFRMAWNLLTGKKGRARIGLKPGIKDPSKKFNYIDRLYPKETPNFEPGRF